MIKGIRNYWVWFLIKSYRSMFLIVLIIVCGLNLGLNYIVFLLIDCDVILYRFLGLYLLFCISIMVLC